MASFRYSGIPDSIATEVRQTMRSPQYGHPAHREVASGTGPCRLCLRVFAIDREDRILFTYQPFQEPGSLPAPGPVFVHAERCERYDSPLFPPDFRELPLMVEGFRDRGVLLVQERVGDDVPEEVVARVFENSSVAYAHLRNGGAGCFMARIDRGVGSN